MGELKRRVLESADRGFAVLFADHDAECGAEDDKNGARTEVIVIALDLFVGATADGSGVRGRRKRF